MKRHVFLSIAGEGRNHDFYFLLFGVRLNRGGWINVLDPAKGKKPGKWKPEEDAKLQRKR
jgi:hypothetical protein